jgi:hypothetical protein
VCVCVCVRAVLTEPSAIGVHSCLGDFFRMEWVVKDFSFLIANGPRVVHLQPVDSGLGSCMANPYGDQQKK